MRRKISIIFTVLAILLLFPTTVFAGTQTWSNGSTTVTFTTPESHEMCQATGGSDTLSVQGLPADWTLRGYVQSQYVLADGSRQTVMTYNVNFVSDGVSPFSLTVAYPPVSQWPMTDAQYNTHEMHVDIAILVAYDEFGQIVYWVGPPEAPGTLGPGNDWDVWCQFAPPPPPPPPNAPGTGTPGYWGRHPEAWPVSSIVIGGVTYTREQAIAGINAPVKKDKTYTMFPNLVAAKLNVLIGNPSSCIASAITEADAWMAAHPLGSQVTGNSDAWGEGGPLASRLDDYNNGLLCAPHRN